jgi:hypothetical protein
VEVMGNIYEHDLVEKYKYGVTTSFKPVTKDMAKKKFVNAVKKSTDNYREYTPTQATIPDMIGIRMQEVVTELRDELVKEAKLIRLSDERYWMCKAI